MLPAGIEKAPICRLFLNGRGGFRTCDLSRVNTIASTGGQEETAWRSQFLGRGRASPPPCFGLLWGMREAIPHLRGRPHSRSSSSKSA